MPDRTAADFAAIEHIFTTLNQQIADATRVAVSQETAAEKEPKYSRREGHRESAEFHRALANVTSELAELAKAALTGAGKEWGVRVTNRGTGRVEDIPQPSEASARRRVERESSTGILVCRIASDWFEAEPSADTHFCGNCLGVDPDTCMHNGMKEGT